MLKVTATVMGVLPPRERSFKKKDGSQVTSFETVVFAADERHQPHVFVVSAGTRGGAEAFFKGIKVGESRDLPGSEYKQFSRGVTIWPAQIA